MPLVVQLLCKKHVEDDITRRLQEFGVGKKSKEILAWSTTHHQMSLTSMSIKDVTGTISPRFFKWFCKTQVTDIKRSMILSVRQDAGLGVEHFYNNAFEVINRRLKSQSQQKKQNIPDFTDNNIKQLLQEKARTCEGSLIGKGA